MFRFGRERTTVCADERHREKLSPRRRPAGILEDPEVKTLLDTLEDRLARVHRTAPPDATTVPADRGDATEPEAAARRLYRLGLGNFFARFTETAPAVHPTRAPENDLPSQKT